MPPLPEGWSAVEVVEDIIVADGVELRRAGLAAVSPRGEEITGAAAEGAGSPTERARYELFERVALLEAIADRGAPLVLRDASGVAVGSATAGELFPESPDPSEWRHARSNGVALHRDWAHAAERARWELVERDRILRCWYGETTPRRLTRSLAGTPLAAAASYDFTAYELPPVAEDDWSAGVSAVGVFGFPRTPAAPMVVGYGARAAVGAALTAATREAVQVLAFLWGEEVPTARPKLSPTSGYHLEHLLWPDRHQALRQWLAGTHAQFRGVLPQKSANATTRYADLTPGWMPDGMRVAKAMCDAAAPLAFGNAPFAGHLPRDLRVHPIA